ncbi:MAG: CoA pyrophosphatase [Acidobacteria bacterium]|nr:CoA pyrophosphatase [Acidobacteriota bacterium]
MQPIDRIAARLAALEPRLSPPGSYTEEAAVAVCLRPAGASAEILLVRRAEHPLDPWSGDAAFPGGRRDPSDLSLSHTAVRETLEETGLDLNAGARLLGRLDDVHPRVVSLPSLNVSSFAFAIPEGATASARSEIVAAHWIPIGELVSPERQASRVHQGKAGERVFPSIRYGDLEIWGLTHRILSQLLDLARS